VDFYEDSTIHNSRNKGKIKIVTSNSLHHDSILTAGSNFKLKSSLPRSRTSHLVTCTYMEHGNSSHAHTVYQMLVTHWVKFEPIFLPNPTVMCGLFPMVRTNKSAQRITWILQ